MPLTASTLTVLTAAEWQPLQAAHRERVDAVTIGHRTRAGGQIPHPVEDFLFTYYSLRPSQLRRWYPGVGVALAGAGDRLEWRYHRELRDDAATVDQRDRSSAESSTRGPLVTVDLPGLCRNANTLDG